MLLMNLVEQEGILLDPEDLSTYMFKQAHINSGYVIVMIDAKPRKLHQLLIDTSKCALVDHKNRNKLDLRKENLRGTTYQINNLNKELQSNNSSGYRGVCWHKGKKKWTAQIRANKKQIWLGDFTVKENAARAYNEAAILHFGEHAQLNILE